MLDLCIEGMGDEVEVKKFYPHKMKIGPCTGCFSCWTKTPGVCAQKDDFQQILDIYKQADYFLLATPLYIFGFPATVKNVIDRLFIILEPAQVKSPRGGTEHPKRFDCHPKSVLISSCGFPEIPPNFLSILFPDPRHLSYLLHISLPQLLHRPKIPKQRLFLLFRYTRDFIQFRLNNPFPP